MAEVTLDEGQFNTLQRGMALLQKLSTDPKTKRQFERVVKEIEPGVETTDDIITEAARPYVEQIEALKNEFTEYRTGLETREQDLARRQADTELAERFQRLRDKEGLTETGEAKVRELMVARNIPDPEAAFALFERNNPKPAIQNAAWEPDSWNLEQRAVDRDVEGLFKNPDLWADQEIGRVLSEMRNPNQI